MAKKPAYEDALYDMESMGVSIFDAARDYRVPSILRLRDLALERGIPVPKLKGMTEISVAKVRQAAEDGETVASIADMVYADRQTVTRLCKNYGIEVAKDPAGRGQRIAAVSDAAAVAQPDRKRYTEPGSLDGWADAESVPDEFTQRSSSPWPAFVKSFAESGRRLVSKRYGSADEAVNVAANIRRAAKKAGLPATAVARLGTVYMSRTDRTGDKR